MSISTTPSPLLSTPQSTSMSRDQFAGLAMVGMLARGVAVVGDRAMSIEEKNANLAEQAYQIADAMIAEGKK